MIDYSSLHLYKPTLQTFNRHHRGLLAAVIVNLWFLCWMCEADTHFLFCRLAVLSHRRPDLLKALFPNCDNKIHEETKRKHGVYSVILYKDNEPHCIVVDDRFPTDKWKRPCFGRSTQLGEIWVSLLEKAWAKLYGSYAAIEGGWVDQALADLTGGIPSRIKLKELDKPGSNGGIDSPDKVWAAMLEYHKLGHLLGAGSPSGSDSPENASALGIVQGHAYAILQVREVDGHRLIQLKNPWARTEWKGTWSDGDTANWTRRMKKKLGWNKFNGDDGVFWIQLSDFIDNFRQVYVCRLLGGSDWPVRMRIDSEWTSATAGGCTNYGTVSQNPHYRLRLVAPETRIAFHLSQADWRGAQLKQGQRRVEAIGLEIYKDFAENERVDRKSGKKLLQANEGSYTYSRDVVLETTLKVDECGDVLTVMCSTFHPRKCRSFTLKVYADQPITFERMGDC
ncbi:MAG: hypothetical protein MHM6MM_000909 [Cercozoa sp. M6MM]